MYVIVVFYVSRSSETRLMDHDSSIAIWNKHRVVVAISLGIWMINIAFLIQGEFRRLPLNHSVARNLIQTRLNSGIARVNDETILYLL